jgi:calcium-dependent protein kinase
MMTKLGTPYYVSPEVLEGMYDKRCDLWAIGVISYILLSGSPPFSGKNELDVFNNIRSCNYDFPNELFEFISEDAKDFIFNMLQPDPENRMTAD